MSDTRYLFFATERYAIPILAPLARLIVERGFAARWWAHGGAESSELEGLPRIASASEAVRFSPRAVFSAANWVPHFVSGVKVQLFHGFNVEKRDQSKGHFRIRGLFDLYCTQGPATTGPFRDIAARDPHFAVVETGWPKLDPLFRPCAASRALRPADGRAVVMMGSTFTPRLSAAPHLLDEMRRLVARGDRYYLLTLHPKCANELFNAYRALAGPNARFIEPEHLVEAEAAADALIADTSSIVSEFVTQHKAVVTFRNRAPKPHMIDIDSPDQLDAAIERALHPDATLRQRLSDYAAAIHPARDGLASQRVLEAVEHFLAGGPGALKPKPFNFFRKWQIRRQVGYYGFGG